MTVIRIGLAIKLAGNVPATLVKLLTSADSAGRPRSRRAPAALWSAEPAVLRLAAGPRLAAMRSHARSQIQLLQVLIAFFFPRKEFLNALQAFNRLGAHADTAPGFSLSIRSWSSGAQASALRSGGLRRRFAMLVEREAMTL